MECYLDKIHYMIYFNALHNRLTKSITCIHIIQILQTSSQHQVYLYLTMTVQMGMRPTGMVVTNSMLYHKVSSQLTTTAEHLMAILFLSMILLRMRIPTL